MKTYKYWHLCLALLLNIGYISCAQNIATIGLKEDEEIIEFTTDSFTLPNLHVTPNGGNIIFDVLGDIYQVPIEGGEAEVLLQDNHWKRGAKLSPDGKTLAYVSDETGEFQVWTFNLETKKKRKYPIKEFVRYPLHVYWKDEIHLLIPNKDGLISYNINTGKDQLIRPALEEERSVLHTINRTMSINSSGNYAFFQKNGDLWAYDIEKNIDLYIKSIINKTFLQSIKGSANGEIVLFYKKQEKNNSQQDLIRWNLTTNNLEILNTTQVLGISTFLNYSFDFIDDNTIVLDDEGAIIRMDIETGEIKQIPIEVKVKKVIKKPLRREPQHIKDSIITASVLRNPVTRLDLDTIYFGVFGKLHSYAKKTEQITEIYPEEDRFEVSPSLSPDGKFLAYTTWKDDEMGHVYAREINSGNEYQLTNKPGRYINPAWSPDGTELVFVVDETEAKMGIPLQSGGSNTSSYYLELHRIRPFENNYLQTKIIGDTIKGIYPLSVMPRRFYPIPVYHSSGKSVYLSKRNREKNISVLSLINLNNKAVDYEQIIPFHTDEVVVSPNAKHIAFIYDEKVWVDEFPYGIKLEFFEGSEFVPKQYHYKGGYPENVLLPQAKKVYEVAPSYLAWKDKYTVMWGSTSEVYTYDIRTGKTEKIADIKVQIPRAVPKTQYALTNVRIITMNKQNEIIEKGTVLVKDNRIKEIGEVDKIIIPENYKLFDLEGKTIMPGFIDVHAHYHHFPYEFQAQQNYKYIGNLAYGVTTIYDPSVNVLDYRERAQMVELGKLLGPRVFASGNIIGASLRNYDFRTLRNREDAVRIMESNNKLNVHGPIKEYHINNQTVKRNTLIRAARNNNLTITSHQDYILHAMSCILNGYTAVEHEIGSFPLQNDFTNIIGQSGVFYTPTIIVRPGIKNIYLNVTSKEKNKLLKFNGKLLYNNYINNSLDSDPKELKKDGILTKEQERAIKTIKNIFESGGKICVGGHGNPLPGIGTHWELWFMTKSISNYQALKAATINGAEKLDLQEEIGSIEKGKLSDIIIFNSNPLEDIFNTIDIFYTIQNGNIYEAETMKQVFPFEKQLKPWGWKSPIIMNNIDIE